MSILKDDGEDVRSELSYAGPEVAPDASPIPVPSSAPPEETPEPSTPAPAVPATSIPGPDPSEVVPFVQPVSYLTFHTEQECQRFFAYRRELHLQRTWQKPQTSLFGAWRTVLDAEDRRQQEAMERALDEELEEEARDFVPVTENFFDEGTSGMEDERMREVEEEITDKAEEPHKVRGLLDPCFFGLKIAAI